MQKALYMTVVCAMMFFFSHITLAQDVSFEIKAAKDGFTPSSITVPKGQKVSIKFISVDVEHGIHMDEFGLKNTIIPERDSVTLEFTADKAGAFSFPCTKFCSWRHLLGMRPRLEVKITE
ncbi:MAG: cupredoxin domain-containing protein [Deltaproteobacteria bacterium]|nr:cupredoxin domain-containing protein [Deltaproteobacteria bacterium]